MTHILAAIAVAITILLGALADDASGQDRALVEEWTWTCTTPIEKALLLDRLPPECIAPDWLVVEVLRDMAFGGPEPPLKGSTSPCICPVSCLRAGGCAPGEWDGL